MLEIVLQMIAAQAGLRPLEHPALFDDLLDDAPPQAGFVCVRTGSKNPPIHAARRPGVAARARGLLVGAMMLDGVSFASIELRLALSTVAPEQESLRQEALAIVKSALEKHPGDWRAAARELDVPERVYLRWVERYPELSEERKAHMTVEEMIAQGYQQTSSKYRIIARLPPGKTAVEALRDVSPHDYAMIVARIEQQCASTYRRTYAAKEGNELVLSPEEFAAFKAAGGETSW